MNRDLRLSPFIGTISRPHTSWENSRTGTACPREILELLDLSRGERATGSSNSWWRPGLVVWPAKGELMLTELGLEKAAELEREPWGQ